MKMFLFICLSLICNVVFAQKCLIFGYDKDGNSVKRVFRQNCDTDDVVEQIDFSPSVRPTEETVDTNEEGNKIYPNPTSGKVFIDIEAGQQYLCEIFDSKGMMVFRVELVEGEALDLSSLRAGPYLLNILTKEGMKSRVIIKK